MKTAKIQDLNEGDILARPITDSYGRVLLQKGVKFTNRIIQRCLLYTSPSPRD